MASPSAFELNPDGSAKRPAEFQAALRTDPEKLSAVSSDPEVAKVVLGDDVDALQALLRGIYKVCSPHCMSEYTHACPHAPMAFSCPHAPMAFSCPHALTPSCIYPYALMPSCERLA